MHIRLPAACAAFAFAIVLAGCRSAGDHAGQMIQVPGEYALRLGQSLLLPDGSRLTYARLVADSRCRPGVQCIRAGDADLELQWQPAAGASRSAVLNSDPRNLQQAPNAVRFGEWQLRLQALDWQQPPRATLAITRQ